MSKANLVGIEDWVKKYLEIAEFMGYDVERDRAATKAFAEMLRMRGVKPPVNELRRLLFKREVMVFGAGPSLDDAVSDLLSVYPEAFKKLTLVAADGATQALVEREITPQVIVTDLDGDFSSIMLSARRGSIIALHVHGDNLDRVEERLDRILSATKLLIGTTQVEPIPPLMNFGGFTDGDRAVFMANHFKSSKVVLVGMDFGGVVGRRSKPWLRRSVPAWRDKAKKLKVAYELISMLASKLEIYTTSINAPLGVKRIKISELKLVLS